MKYLIRLLIIVIILGVSCKKKQNCSGTNSISGVLKNGTTMKGMKNVQLKLSIYDLDYDGRTKDTKELGYVSTDDTGGFYFEYPCQDKEYDKIAIDAQAPFSTYLNARESYTKNLKKTFYHSTVGSAQIVLKPKTPIGRDTIYVGIQLTSGTFSNIDSFVNSTPYLWKRVSGSTGGYGSVIWGRGKSNYNRATKEISLKQWQSISISGDPVVDSIYVNY